MEEAKLVVVGAGPAGLATAVEAKAAGISPVVVLEKKGAACDTIVSLYHEGKRVDPVFKKVKLDPIGKLSFDTETREEFLERMDRVIKEHDLDIRYWNEVQKVIEKDGIFHVYTGDNLHITAPVLVIAIGVFGKPIKPGYPIPKEVKDKVFFALPKEPIKGKKVLVVGGGDTAAETACFLSEHNETSLSYRRAEFFRLNDINACTIDDCACKGTINLMMGTDIDSLEPSGEQVLVNFKDGQKIAYDAVFYCLGGMTPKTFLEGIGVEFDGKRAKVDQYGETNIKRVFLAGDLVADKGTIMAAFNSGKTVVDGILARYADLVK